MVGNDGAQGASSALDGKLSLHKAIIQVPGVASVVKADKARQIALTDDAFRSLLIRHEQVLFASAQQAAACNASHLVEARLCRWMLRMRDLVGDDLPLTQEFVRPDAGRPPLQRVVGGGDAAIGRPHQIPPRPDANPGRRWSAGSVVRVLRDRQKPLRIVEPAALACVRYQRWFQPVEATPILNRRDREYVLMSEKCRQGLTTAEKPELWHRWQPGIFEKRLAERLVSVTRVLRRPVEPADINEHWVQLHRDGRANSSQGRTPKAPETSTPDRHREWRPSLPRNRKRVMPIFPIFANAAFGPELTKIMGEALDRAVEWMRVAPSRRFPVIPWPTGSLRGRETASAISPSCATRRFKASVLRARRRGCAACRRRRLRNAAPMTAHARAYEPPAPALFHFLPACYGLSSRGWPCAMRSSGRSSLLSLEAGGI